MKVIKSNNKKILYQTKIDSKNQTKNCMNLMKLITISAIINYLSIEILWRATLIYKFMVLLLKTVFQKINEHVLKKLFCTKFSLQQMIS